MEIMHSPMMLIVDTVLVAGIPKGQCDVEELLDQHGKVKPNAYKIMTTHPLTRTQKLEAISKFRSDDLTLIF